MVGSILEKLVAQQAALAAERERTLQRVLGFPRVLQAALATRTGATAHDVVFEVGPLKLMRYRRERPAAHVEPVLFCYALINRPYILDLLPNKSVVRHYLERDFDVYMIDWGIPGDADRTLGLADYVSEFLRRAVDFVLQSHGCQKLHLLGYCMGGTMSALFTALRPEVIRTLTLLAAPIDFGGQEGLLNLWTDHKYFDVDAFIETNGNCPATFLQSCFLFMKPVQNLLAKTAMLCEQMGDPAFVENYFAMEHWVNDNVPVAGQTFREFVKNLYQRNELVRGEFRLGEQYVDLGRVRCPVLLLTAKNDHLVAPSSTLGIRPHLGSRDVEAMTIDAGHVGLVVSSKAQKKLWPEATRWLVQRASAAPAIS